jgi:hypothetical protein
MVQACLNASGTACAAAAIVPSPTLAQDMLQILFMFGLTAASVVCLKLVVAYALKASLFGMQRNYTFFFNTCSK